MANMTRAEMVTELNARGWSRFTPGQLNRYLDWALQDVYSKAKFDRSVLTTYTEPATVLDIIPFTSLSGGAAELVNQIEAVYVQQNNASPQKLTPATEREFLDTIWRNSQDPNPDVGVPTTYYVFDLGVYVYPKPNPALDIIIHHQLREDVFSSDGDTSSLPERFDKAILMLAEIHCNRRSRNHEELAVAQALFDEFLLNELGMAGTQMAEATSRIDPWRG